MVKVLEKRKQGEVGGNSFLETDCKVCDITFATETELKDHILTTVHRGPSDGTRNFKYRLTAKTAKKNIIKGAQRKHMDVQHKQGAINVDFSDGAWIYVAFPEVLIWAESNKNFDYGDLCIKVMEVKAGMDNGNKNIDHKIEFQVNDQKVVLHAYNTKQRFTVTGQGYKVFVEKYLDPILREKVESCLSEANNFNKQVMENLGKTVKRGDVKFKTSSSVSCKNCSKIEKSISQLHEHMLSKHVHMLSKHELSKSLLTEPAILNSTKNTSSTDRLMIEDMSINGIDAPSLDEAVELSEERDIKRKNYNCDVWYSDNSPCGYKSPSAADMLKHTEKYHSNEAAEIKDNKIIPNDSQINDELEKGDDVADKVIERAEQEEEENVDEIPKEEVIDQISISNIFEVKATNYQCSKCTFISKTESGMSRHESLFCDLCKICLEGTVEFDIHKRFHSTCNSNNCYFTAKGGQDLKEHVISIHGRHTCTLCRQECKDEESLKLHQGGHTEKVKQDSMKRPEEEFKCERCEFSGQKKIMEEHLMSKHTEQYPCQMCGIIFVNDNSLKDHIIAEHTSPPHVVPFPCGKCGLVLATFPLLQDHMNSHHNQGIVKCRFCDLTAETEDSLEEHILQNHEEFVVLHSMAKQVETLCDKSSEFDTFKSDVSSALRIVLDTQKQILHKQTIIEQELFLSRLNNGPTVSQPSHSTQSSELNAPGPARRATSPPPPPPPRHPNPSPPQKTPPSSSHPSTPAGAQVSKPTQNDVDNKTLYIGDSISSNVNIEALETATQSQFCTAKAYSSVHDTVENVAKHAAKFPKSNFTDVIPMELKKDNYKTLIIQSGSVDISNLKTKDNPERHIEYFRQEAVMSATNIFSASENALKIKPTLTKVVLMKQIPRYDPLHVDPLGLKPNLSHLFNNTLTELWMKSVYKDRIHVGTHNIECTGAIKEARYRHTRSGRFDGIHLIGSSGQKAYTLSVLNILRAANITTPEHDYHQSCPQFRYQTRRTQHSSHRTYIGGKQTWKKQEHFWVPTHNRFSSLSDYNQGNW